MSAHLKLDSVAGAGIGQTRLLARRDAPMGLQKALGQKRRVDRGYRASGGSLVLDYPNEGCEYGAACATGDRLRDDAADTQIA